VEVEQVRDEVARAARTHGRLGGSASGAGSGNGSGNGSGTGTDSGAGRDHGRDQGHEAGDGHGDEHSFELARPDIRDPVVSAERQLLQASLQFPSLVDPAGFESLTAGSFSAPAHRGVHDAIQAAGGIRSACGGESRWADRVSEAAALTVRPLVSELAVASVPARVDPLTGLPERRYVDELLVRIQEVALTRQIGDAISAMRRVPPDDTAAGRALGVQLQTLQRELADLRLKLG
jgi:DNA primase